MSKRKKYTLQDGYTVEDMMHFGFGHIDAAITLFKDDAAFLDSAGYLAHLGVEIVLKAWWLHQFKYFEDIHKLSELKDKLSELQNGNNVLTIDTKHEKFLTELDKFYMLRYPRRQEGPIEVGSDHLPQLEELIAALWQVFPQDLIDIYNSIDQTKKGGRVLMSKKIVHLASETHIQ